MDNELRDSGIQEVGKIPWGTHISQIYSSKEDFHLPVPFIKTGLQNNERCVWIYSPNITEREIMEMLERQLPDAQAYAARRQLILMPHDRWYMSDQENFNEVRVSGQWNEMIRKALDKGYDGLRAVADTRWLDKCYFRDFSRYEHNINGLISELPFIVICQYDAERFSLVEFAEIIRNHSFTIVKMNSDIKVIQNTELMLKNNQLEASRENYNRLLDSLPDAIFIHDGRRILYCNEAAASVAGFTNSTELTGRPIAELIAEEARESFLSQTERLLKGEPEVGRMQSMIETREGEFIDIDITTITYSFRGFPALLSVVRDISYQEKINELESDIQSTLEIDRMKTDFFSNISHELRTPISIILTALQMLQMQYGMSVRDARYKYHQIIQQNCFRLLKLVNNLIDLNKIDSDFFDLHKQNCNIVGILRTITESVVDYAKEKNIHLLFETDTAEKKMACDPNAIERIVLNLISNALKFTPTGGHIRVALSDLGTSVAFSVEDDGIGIPPEKQEIIFDRYRQSGNHHIREKEGSGIGLALVKSMVEKHNGTISVKSECGRGSEFRVELPCYLMHEITPADHITELTQSNIAERINIEFSDIYSVSVR